MCDGVELLLNCAAIQMVTENPNIESGERLLAIRFEKASERVSNGKNLCGPEEMADDYGDMTKMNMVPLFGAKKDECCLYKKSLL